MALANTNMSSPRFMFQCRCETLLPEATIADTTLHATQVYRQK